MKRLLLLGSICLLARITLSQDTTIYYINDGFETTPRQWISQPSVPYLEQLKWEYRSGGNNNLPTGAKEGSYNAFLYWNGFEAYTSDLVSPVINLSTSVKPQLTFYHAQAESSDGIDHLVLMFRAGVTGTWDTIMEYYSPSVPSTQWFPQRTFNIDEYGSKYLTNEFYIAFSGTVIGGHGVCIDDVKIEEKEIINRYVYSVNALHVAHSVVPSGVMDLPMFRVDIDVVGNNETLTLDSLKIKSLCSDNDVFKNNGFELFHTRDEIFRNENKGVSTRIGTAQNISNGIIKFSNLATILKTGKHCLWLVADIKSDATPGANLDFMLDANSVSVSGNSYPTTSISPSGSNTVDESIFFDDFETDRGWTLENDFERDVPKGKFVIKSYDPDYAYSGEKVLGTDLNDDGAYPLNIDSANAYFATTPLMNLKYFDKIKLSLWKWNYIEPQDNGSIDISTDGGTSWTRIWLSQASGQQPEFLWNNLYLYNEVNNLAKRQANVKFRVAMNYSDNNNAYAGWNIDNFAITGEYLTNDVGITRVILPCDDCIKTGEDDIQVVVRNYAAIPSPANTRIFFSLYGSQGPKTYDTIVSPIPVDDSVTFTFTPPANFPAAGAYDFLVSTDAIGDQDRTNDTMKITIHIQENIDPPRLVDFETGNGYWIPGGIYKTWECKIPDASIGQIEGSPNAWILSPYGNYLSNDSSFIVSSCYNLISSDKLVLENKYWILSEDGNDGANIQYTINDGATWNVLTKNTYGYPWQWYENYVTALKNIGWSGSSDSWQTARTLLPESLHSQPRVKFRVLWQSDADTSNRGLAFDDFKICPAPYDIGVSAIDSFATRCEGLNPDQVTVTIKNHGINSMKISDTIIVGFGLNSSPVAVDTFQLTQALLPGQTIKHTFAEKIDVLTPATYTLKAYTLTEDDPYYYGTNNDTLSLVFTVLPNPTIGLLDTIQTKEPDTVILRPYYHADYDYLWFDGKTTSTYDVDKGGVHSVTVTATRGNGCSAKDSTYVELLFYDVGVDSLIYPVDACLLSTHEYVTFRIRNYGTDSIPAGENIKTAFVFNGTTTVIDTLTLANTLYSKQTLQYTFDKGAVDLNSAGTYPFKLYADYAGDTVYYNDTINRSIVIFGNPTADLGPDRTIEALSYVLDAGSGYIDYLWDNATTSQTREITESGNYWVWILDGNNCSDFDTVYVRLKIRDISPQLVSPLSACTFSSSETVQMRVVNTGTDTVPSGETINVRYKMNTGGWVTESFVLSGQMIPAASVIHTFPGSVNLSTPDDYLFTLVAKTTTDIRMANDTLYDTVYRYPEPVVDFGLGESYQVRATEFTIDAGYQPYCSYLWQDNSTNYEYVATTSGIKWAKVTDTRTACYGGDTVVLFLIIDDLGVVSTTLGSQVCSGPTEDVQVTIKNLGTTNIGVGEKIYLGYDVDGSRIHVDTIALDRVFSTQDSRIVTLQKPITINAGTSPAVDFYTLLDVDMRPENDTLTSYPSVLPSPVVDFGDVNGVLMTPLPHTLDAGSGHKSYLWNNGSTAQTLNVTANGVYSVTVTGQNDCQTTKVVYINITALEDMLANGMAVTVYPNPSNGLFNLDITMESPQDLIITMVNINGQVVLNQQVTVQEKIRYPVDLTGYPRGMYQILITGDKVVYKAKIIVY
ncbi:MAG: T9SS type A sorting domain-containing protein [Bacteroidales bacterium]|nr:T9SS type A sorting domain-containing protein [Bacteroidales bacterium]